MTKEEALNKHDSSHKYIEQTCRPELFAAMDEWAIQFGKWLQGCSYSPTMDDNTWINMIPGENNVITTEELYELYLKSK